MHSFPDPCPLPAPRRLPAAHRLEPTLTSALCVPPELQQFYGSQSRLPDSRVVLCFGEEFPDMAPLRSKLILVQVRERAARCPGAGIEFALGLR